MTPDYCSTENAVQIGDGRVCRDGGDTVYRGTVDSTRLFAILPFQNC